MEVISLLHKYIHEDDILQIKRQIENILQFILDSSNDYKIIFYALHINIEYEINYNIESFIRKLFNIDIPEHLIVWITQLLCLYSLDVVIKKKFYVEKLKLLSFSKLLLSIDNNNLEITEDAELFRFKEFYLTVIVKCKYFTTHIHNYTHIDLVFVESKNNKLYKYCINMKKTDLCKFLMMLFCKTDDGICKMFIKIIQDNYKIFSVIELMKCLVDNTSDVIVNYGDGLMEFLLRFCSVFRFNDEKLYLVDSISIELLDTFLKNCNFIYYNDFLVFDDVKISMDMYLYSMEKYTTSSRFYMIFDDLKNAPLSTIQNPCLAFSLMSKANANMLPSYCSYKYDKKDREIYYEFLMFVFENIPDVINYIMEFLEKKQFFHLPFFKYHQRKI